MAEVNFHIDSTAASSHVRSPYGSFVISENLSPDLIRQFVAFTEKKLKESGVAFLLLKNPPEAYSKEIGLIQQVLIESGYRISLEETSSVLMVDQRSFSTNLNRSKRGLLKKAYNNQFKFEQFPVTQLTEIYEFLKTCYSAKGYNLSMSLQEVQRVIQTFPDHFFLHGIVHNGRLIAASICIRVNPTVLYTFYYNHVEEYDPMSPIVFLVERLYEFCWESNVSLLDLGTSNIGPQLNEPLIFFKLSLGAKPSRKLTFVKNLS